MSFNVPLVANDKLIFFSIEVDPEAINKSAIVPDETVCSIYEISFVSSLVEIKKYQYKKTDTIPSNIKSPKINFLPILF